MNRYLAGAFLLSIPAFLGAACGGGDEEESKFGPSGGSQGTGASSSGATNGSGASANGPGVNIGGDDGVAMACEEHGDCPKGQFCAEDSECAPSMSGSPCADDDNCHTGETCVNGHCGCNAELYEADAIPPNILIVLDRSNSMVTNCVDSESGEVCDCGDGDTCLPRWEIAVAAVGQLVDAAGATVRFGLEVYPGDDQNCQAGGHQCGETNGVIGVDVGDDTAEDIKAYLADATTCNLQTPTAAGLRLAADYSGIQDPERGNYVLLITDGDSTCDDPPQAVATTLLGLEPSVGTFAVGFGSGITDAGETELNALAENGGTALDDGPPSYYVADNAEALADALAAIAGSVLSCNYSLSDAPDDLDQLFVYLGMDQIERDPDHNGGWDYDADNQQLVFYGAECEALEGGAADSLTIAYGCPPPDDVLK